MTMKSIGSCYYVERPTLLGKSHRKKTIHKNLFHANLGAKNGLPVSPGQRCCTEPNRNYIYNHIQRQSRMSQTRHIQKSFSLSLLSIHALAAKALLLLYHEGHLHSSSTPVRTFKSITFSVSSLDLNHSSVRTQYLFPYASLHLWRLTAS